MCFVYFFFLFAHFNLTLCACVEIVLRHCKPDACPMPAYRRPLRSFCFAFFSGAENKLKSENVSFLFFVRSSIFYGLCCWRFLVFEAKPGYVSHFSSCRPRARPRPAGCPCRCCRWFCFTRRVRRLQCLRTTKNLQSTNAAAGLKPKKNAARTCATLGGYPLQGVGPEGEASTVERQAAHWVAGMNGSCVT